MQLTPTDKGSGIAGIAFASLAWFSLFKLDHLAKLCRLDRWIKRDKLFTWIVSSTSTKSLTLLFTEVVNFGTHGITNPASVLFACGSTIVNIFMIFVGLPLHVKARRERVTILAPSPKRRVA